MRAIIIERRDGKIDLEYVRIGKRGGMLHSEEKRIGDYKQDYYLYVGMEEQKIKKMWAAIT